VRLASQLTGWRLDILGESKFKQMEEEAISALATIEGVDNETARTMYKLGFRTLDEVADASETELGGIPGLGGPGNAPTIKKAAEGAMEIYRQKRVSVAATKPDALTEREKMTLVPGMTARVLEALESNGYRSVEDLLHEEDSDRLALQGRRGTPRHGLKILARDPILLANPDGLQPPLPYVVSDRPDMQVQQAGYLFDRVELLWHKTTLSVPIIRVNR